MQLINPETDRRYREKAKRALRWAIGQKAPPYLINFYFTTRCNLKCRFCDCSGVDGPLDYTGELSKEELLKFAEDGCRFGIEDWFLAGGEPFVHRETLLLMMEIIKKHKKFGNVNTNGLLVNEEAANRIVAMQWDDVTFSINGPNPEIDNFLRGLPDTFKKCTNNIKKLNEIKARYDSTKPEICIHTVITNKNYDRLSDMIKLGYELKADSVNFTHLMEQTTLVKSMMLDKRQLNTFKQEVKKAIYLSRELGIFTNLENYADSPYNDAIGKYQEVLTKKTMQKNKNNLLSSVCFEPWVEIGAFYDGSIGPCGNWDPKSCTENIRDKSIEQIWYGKEFDRVRKNFMVGKYDKYCADCASSRIYRNEDLKNAIDKLLQ